MATETQTKKPPKIEVDVRGTIDQLQQQAVDAYRESNPGEDVEFRWALAPEEKKTHSKVAKHRAQGYKLVKVEDLDLGMDGEIFGGPSDPVRVADTVLMVCEKERKLTRRLHLDSRAMDMASLSERREKESIETAGSVPGRGGVKAGGSMKKTFTDEEVKIPEPRKEE